MKKGIALLLTAAMVCTFAAGCGKQEKTGKNREDEVNQQANDAERDTSGTKTLTFGIQNYGGGGIDPAGDTNTAWNCSRYGVGECLFMFDNAMQVQSKLCDRYAVNDEHTEWEFHIRDGVKFSDGCPCDAEAVAASFERLYRDGLESATPDQYLEKEAKITADNETNIVTIKTTKPYVDLTQNLCYPVMCIVDTAHTTDYDHGVIGTGPYAAENYKEDVGYTLVKNEYYWDGTVPCAAIELLYMGDASAKAMALQSGQLDLAENVTNADDLRMLQEDPAYTVTVASSVRTSLGHINMAEGKLLSNKTLRQAVLMALDNEAMCEVTVGGLYTAGFAPLPSNLDYGYEDLENPYSFDPDGAAKLLDEAGIVDSDGDGTRNMPDGRPVVLKLTTYPNRCLDTFAEAIQQQLAEIGIGVDLQISDSAGQWDSYTTGDFDITGSCWNTTPTGDPTKYLEAWYSKSTGAYCGYRNADYDALFEELEKTYNPDTRKEIIRQMQQILIDDAAAVIYGYYNSSMISRNETVGGAAIHTADYYWITTEIYPAK